MRIIFVLGVLGFLTLAAPPAPARAQESCDGSLGQIVTATGTVSDFTYQEARDRSQFFIRDTNLPCRADIWVFVSGRIRCNDGKHATIVGKFDGGEMDKGGMAYILITDAEHTRCN